MSWIGLIAGLLAAWWLGEIFGEPGGLVALGAIVGLLLGRMQGRLNELAAELATLKQLRRPPPPAVAAPSPAPTAVKSPAPTPTPAGPALESGFGPTRPDHPNTVPLPPFLPPAAPSRPRPVLEPDEHSIAVTGALGASLLAWFRGGNTIVRVAVLILFIGVAFLLRYAAEHTTVPIEWRLAGVALGGLALTVLGLRLTPRRRGYGLSLQGAGLGIVYLTLFAAYRLYALLPTTLSFALLAAMAAITTALALRQNALPLAALGFGGAFLAPVLTSTGHGSHVALFSYQLLLNVAIAVIARLKAWKLLNLEGFVFTFGIGAAWGLQAYTAENFWSTEPFLLAHFLLYLFIAVQYTLRMLEAQAKPALPLVDGSLLFGTPIVAFGLQAAMLRDQPMGLAFSAAILAGLYLVIGQILWKRAGQRILLLVEGLVALGLVFLALVTPLALDARWTSAAWALQGLGVLWVALRQRRWWAAAMGLLLQFGAAISFWGVSERLTPAMSGHLLFFNSAFLSALLLSAAALASARLLGRASLAAGSPVLLAWPLPQGVMLALGLAQLWVGGLIELRAWDQDPLDTLALLSGWSALLMLACDRGQVLLKWAALRWPARLLMLVALMASALAALDTSWTRYTHGFGILEALLLIALARWRLRQDPPSDAPALLAANRLLPAWYAMLQGGLFLYTAGAHFVARHEGWTPAAAILLPTLLALAIRARSPHVETVYRRGLLLPWLIALMAWVLAVNSFCDASMAPLPYLPLLNPLDLAHGLVLIYALRLVPLPGPLKPAAGLLVFWWLNSLLVRTLHQWAGTPMWSDHALRAAPVQTGLSVLWTLSALVTMGYATRRAPPARARGLWMLGAGLLGVVVLKLFLVDLSRLGSLERIVSFMAVGALMLVIGYVSPLPPAAEEKQA